MYKGLLKLVFGFAVIVCVGAQAQEVKLGGQVGALGVGSTTGIGFGLSLQVAPYETVGMRIDANIAKLDGSNYFSTSPMLIWFIPTSEEFKAGLMAGGGFYKIGSNDLKFGLAGGASIDFVMTKNISFGGLVQLHNVFDYPDNVWNVFMTMSMSFGQAGSWDW